MRASFSWQTQNLTMQRKFELKKGMRRFCAKSAHINRIRTRAHTRSIPHIEQCVYLKDLKETIHIHIYNYTYTHIRLIYLS